MVKKEFIEVIRKHFLTVTQKKKILGILLFGSVIHGKETNRSDVDLCIVAPKESPEELLLYILENVNVYTQNYDVKVFSNLPLYIKIQVIEEGILVYSPDKLDLYEHFYFYRKLWKDQKHRQELDKDELISML